MSFKLYKWYQIVQHTTYNTYQKQWIQFSSERNQDPLHPHHVLNFLHFYQICNVGHSIFNTIHSILSPFVEIVASK